MTRIIHRAGSAYATRARSKVAKAKARKHKIILETVTQEKKKLRSVISFEAKAPPGYTFIPAGNPKFTSSCKEICRKDGLKVFTVSTTPHQGMHNLSQQVHRIGYHFPSVVVATVCMDRGVFLSSTGKVMPYRQLPTRSGARGPITERKADSELSQNIINTEARDAIKDLFPNIPAKDLNQIVKTAFRKGKRKVGTAVELPLARRAQLAVVAHIRHVYTKYDNLLKLTSFQEARAAVEEPCLAKLVQWRGDDESGETVLEDVFREVIVISDDEDEDLSEDGDHPEGDRDSSVEIISSNTVVKELQTQPLSHETSATIDRSRVPEPSEDEGHPGVRFIRPLPRKRKLGDKKKLDRRGFSRYQAWDRARDRYRGTLHASNEQPHPAENNDRPVPALFPLPEPQPTRQIPYTGDSQPRALVAKRSGDDLPGHISQHSYQAVENPGLRAPAKRVDPPKIIRLADGSIFERADEELRQERLGAIERSMIPAQYCNSGNKASEQVKYHTFRNRQPIALPKTAHNDIGHPGRPSVRGHFLDDENHGYMADSGRLMPRKRDFTGLLAGDPYHNQPPLEDVSGRINAIDIDSGRFHMAPKRNRVLLHNSIEEPQTDCQREPLEYPPSSQPPCKIGRLEEDGRFLQQGQRQGNFLQHTSIPSDNFSRPILRPIERDGSNARRRPAGDSQLAEPANIYHSDPIRHGAPNQGLNYVPNVSRVAHGATGTQALFVDSSLYRARNDKDTVAPSQMARISRPQRVMGLDACESQDYRQQKPNPLSSLSLRQRSLERMPAFSQDTHFPRIHSHDFVRPLHSPERQEPHRFPRAPVHERQAQVEDRYSQSTHFIPLPSVGRFPPEHRVTFDPTPNRSHSPPMHHPTPRLLGPGPARPVYAPPPRHSPPLNSHQAAYFTRGEGSRPEALSNGSRPPHHPMEQLPPRYRTSDFGSTFGGVRTQARPHILRDAMPVRGG
ncbi:hypothetical protein LOZ57_000018 [Ophidiomyces ophidiicola]|uniref:uncharacterized protein n=1 Tax=Ophidiomyces ophidiicola TaxID=1387563 RepID=UPI0020C4B844|nr:uncharacterized protein LOZ57_000018 [Ophidiomyces ophidiicola]KAI1953677.1 hypothetical protein LOZ57_000018 [Ophidiomyces ophidiicola]KAI2044380.1 hypothetical protein LOZ43_006383 [Ophidiomyces ophidiicola]